MSLNAGNLRCLLACRWGCRCGIRLFLVTLDTELVVVGRYGGIEPRQERVVERPLPLDLLQQAPAAGPAKADEPPPPPPPTCHSPPVETTPGAPPERPPPTAQTPR